jgi:hypothetical protein
MIVNNAVVLQMLRNVLGDGKGTYYVCADSKLPGYGIPSYCRLCSCAPLGAFKQHLLNTMMFMLIITSSEWTDALASHLLLAWLIRY